MDGENVINPVILALKKEMKKKGIEYGDLYKSSIGKKRNQEWLLF
jgi:hypothetical protein